MVRSLQRAWSRCKAVASSGRTTRKGISTPLGRVSVWSLFMPFILYLWCLYCLRRGVLGTSGVGVSRKFARTRNGARHWRRGPERKSPGSRRFPLKGLWLGVLGPNLAVDLLDEGLAILILLLVLAELLELLDRKAVELLHDVLYSQVLVVRGLQCTEDGGLKLLLPGGPLEGPHALLHVGEGGEEVLVSPHPLLRESPIPLLLLAYAPREGLGGAQLELKEPCAVCEPHLSRSSIVLLQLHELEPVVGKPDAAALDAREVLGEGLVSIALGLCHLAGGARRLVDVSGGLHQHTSVVVDL